MVHECVLELLKLSSNVNECKPLVGGFFATHRDTQRDDDHFGTVAGPYTLAPISMTAEFGQRRGTYVVCWDELEWQGGAERERGARRREGRGREVRDGGWRTRVLYLSIEVTKHIELS